MKAKIMRSVRKVHGYVAVFFAPAIIFFAFSGALQTLGLHESHDPAHPPVQWIRYIGSIHKDQRPPRTEEHNRPPPRSDDGGPPPGMRPLGNEGPSPIPLKAFVILLALGLMTTSALGVVIALQNASTKRIAAILVATGTIVPILILYR